jgi:hypothetical protein
MKYSFFAGIMLSMFLLPGKEASATVVDSTWYGFTVSHEKTVKADGKVLFNVFCKEIGQWWDPEHTWFGNAENLYIQTYIGGGFGEQLESVRAVRHMEVIFLDYGKTIRLQGALGPLQQYPVMGIMTVEFKKEADSTRVSMTYSVGGYIPGGAAKFSGIVDQVLGIQFSRFLAYAEQKK